MKKPIVREIKLKLKVENQKSKEKPAVFCLEIRFFQGANKVLNRLGIQKK